MVGITLSQAQAKLTLWMAADDAVSTGQDYSIAGRKLARADSAEIRNNIEFWERKVKRLTRGGILIRGGTMSR